MAGYEDLTDEQLIQETIEFIKHEQELPAYFKERLRDVDLLHLFITEDKDRD